MKLYPIWCLQINFSIIFDPVPEVDMSHLDFGFEVTSRIKQQVSLESTKFKFSIPVSEENNLKLDG